jgi:hypothetical protein
MPDTHFFSGMQCDTCVSPRKFDVLNVAPCRMVSQAAGDTFVDDPKRWAALATCRHCGAPHHIHFEMREPTPGDGKMLRRIVPFVVGGPTSDRFQVQVNDHIDLRRVADVIAQFPEGRAAEA